MSDLYDVIVVGLGAMGSATAYHLARRGARVLGLEQFAPGHTLGSSHGDSRIIRELYFENPLYVPLVQRAYTLWALLEEEAATVLVHRTGGLMIGRPSSSLVHGALRSGESHGLPAPVLSPEEIRTRFPAFHLPADFVAVWDERAGYLNPEACTSAHAALAERSGAVLHYNEPVTHWIPDGNGVRVTTPAGVYRAARLVICAGAWTKTMLAELELPLVVERQVLVWLDAPRPRALYSASKFPIFICELEDATQFYGFPLLDRGVKTSVFHEGRLNESPHNVDRDVVPADVGTLRARLANVLPDLASAAVRETATCLFTNTPDQHFLIDFHPHHSQVLLSSPCSGHGFKFASALGEVQAELLLDGRSNLDLRPFSLSRFRSELRPGVSTGQD
ncbi:MAG: N-methyl-L-tryptophan oxidase [Gemmatimonadaceae bacterium]